MLVDSGSTHNFVDLAVVRRAQLSIDPKHQLNVTIASGKKIRSEGGICDIKVKLQGHAFIVDACVSVTGL